MNGLRRNQKITSKTVNTKNYIDCNMWMDLTKTNDLLHCSPSHMYIRYTYRPLWLTTPSLTNMGQLFVALENYWNACNSIDGLIRPWFLIGGRLFFASCNWYIYISGHTHYIWVLGLHNGSINFKMAKTFRSLIHTPLGNGMFYDCYLKNGLQWITRVQTCAYQYEARCTYLKV